MRRQRAIAITTRLAFGCVLALFCASAYAQSASPPGTAGGIPRTSDGKPDFSGIWQALNAASYDIQDHHAAPGVPPGMSVVVDGEIPYQTWAVARKQENFANRFTEDTDAKCFMPGVPRITYMPHPFRILQTSDRVDFLYGYIGIVRHVYTDGSPHPHGPIEWWMGDSRGRWENDTLVVDVVHFTDQTRFDQAGNFHTEMLHVVERYSFIDRDHLDYEVTIEDPKVFTRPWKMRMPLYRRIEPHARVLEYYCYGFNDLFHLPTERR